MEKKYNKKKENISKIFIMITLLLGVISVSLTNLNVYATYQESLPTYADKRHYYQQSSSGAITHEWDEYSNHRDYRTYTYRNYLYTDEIATLRASDVGWGSTRYNLYDVRFVYTAY